MNNCIFLSTSDVEPAGLYGGTWEKIAEERTLMGASTTHPVGTTVDAGLPNITCTLSSRASDTYPVKSTGGSATHTQTLDEVAEHIHDINVANVYEGSYTIPSNE